MAELYEADFGTAFYRSRDPIKNLKIRVKLERVTSANIVPQSEVEQETEGDVEMKDLRLKQNFGGRRDAEEFCFKWQEKILSKREVEFYSRTENCDSVLDRKYHEDCKLLEEVGRPTVRLFSYVDHDNYTNTNNELRQMTTSPNEKPSITSEKMANLRHRRGAASRPQGPVSSVNVVAYEPTEELRKQNHLLSTPGQTMYIMADLTPEGKEPTEADEFVLCTIKVDTNGVISVRPDFNKGRKGYKIEAVGMGRDLFEYTVEHASKQLTRQEQGREAKVFRELYSRHADYIQACVGHDFETVPADMLRLLVYGEIMNATNFESDNIYIHYFIELPNGWQSMGLQQLSGVTQTCRSKAVGPDEVAAFSFPFHVELAYRADNLTADDIDTLPKWPQLFMEVLSMDSWQRYRTEGYGHLTLPPTAGLSTHEVQCWRPLGRSCVSEMRRFFVGGNPELEDPTYTALPSTFQGPRASKFGFRTLSTGTVKVQLNVIQQSQLFLQTTSSKRKVGTLMDRLGKSGAQINIMNVLEAFQRAKLRMVAARDNLKQEFVDTLKAYDVGDLDD